MERDMHGELQKKIKEGDVDGEMKNIGGKYEF